MFLLLLALAATPVAPPVAVAPPSAVLAPAERPSEAEALALVQAYSPSALRRESELNILRRDFIPTLQKNPSTAAMLKAFPALGPAFIDALASNIDTYMSEFDARFYPRATQIVRAKLSRADTLEMTRFFRSPLGQRLLRGAVNHVDGSEVAQAGLEGRAIDKETFQRQAMAAGWGMLAELSPEDRAALVTHMMSPTGQRFGAITPELGALQTELANNPGPEFKARSEQAMADAFKRITGLPMISGK